MPLISVFGANIDAETNGSVSVKIPGLPGISFPAAGPVVNQGFSIQNFIQNLAQHNETARTNKFDIMMVPPAAVARYAGVSPAAASKGFNLQCEATQLPGREIQMNEYTIHGFIRRVPHQNQYGQASFTFICTGDFWEKIFFDAWMDMMLPAITGLANYPMDSNNNRNYETDLVINQYDSTGALIYQASLIDATPISMAPLEQSWENESIHKLTVTFQFRKWLTAGMTYNQTTTFGANPTTLPSPSSGQISTSPTAPTAAATTAVSNALNALNNGLASAVQASIK